MSRFYGSLQGQAKTQATRRGSPASGIEGHIRGWHVGVRVRGRPATNDPNAVDVFDIYLTGGSNGHQQDHYLGCVALNHDGKPTFYEG